jgi:hypothetical protein
METKLGSMVTNNVCEVELNLFPHIEEAPDQGWPPVPQNHFWLNQEVYQWNQVTVVPIDNVREMAMVRKHEDLKQSADFCGMKNVYVLRFRRSLMLDNKYEKVDKKHCLPYPSLYHELCMKTCAS